MNELRKIRDEEVEIIKFLIEKSNLYPKQFIISEMVDDYEGGKMGSIGLGKIGAVYESDIIQAEYTDIDGTEVVISLTKDTENQLLDLDFWKTDFSKLLKYPLSSELKFKENYTPFANE
jgi:hypothetical protein